MGDEMTETPPLPCLRPFVADGGFYAWSCPTNDGLHTVIVVNEDGESPRSLAPGESWSVAVLRDSDAEPVAEFGFVSPGELEERVASLVARGWPE